MSPYKAEKNFLKFFFGLAALIIFGWLAFWAAVITVVVLLVFKYLL